MNYLIKKPFHKSLFAFLDLSIRYDAVFKEIVVAMPPNTLIQIIIRINLAIEAMNVFRMW